MNRLSVAALVAVVFSFGCGPLEDAPPSELLESPGYMTRIFELEAPCMVRVEGYGMVNIEDDYIPNVVACENGNAPMEALKAQAVSARGFLYYKLFVAGQTTLRNSTADQVYRCSYRPNGAGPEHIEAARATRGQYLEWDNRVVCAFYVAGGIAPQPGPENAVTGCRGRGHNDPTNTERFVTYNWEREGCRVDMTSLGWTPSDCNRNPHNRGAASQNGAACLAREGWKYQDMMPYYYGHDIRLVSSTGNCGGPPPREVTALDRFCALKSDGSYCSDANTRVRCESEWAEESEPCAEGCENGVCNNAAEPTFCSDLADGWHCADSTSRVQCNDGQITATETCTHGCSLQGCETSSVPDGMNPGPGEPDDPAAPVDEFASVDPRDFPGALSASPGLQGGCSSTGHHQGTLSLLLMVLGIVAIRPRLPGFRGIRAYF